MTSSSHVNTQNAFIRIQPSTTTITATQDLNLNGFWCDGPRLMLIIEILSQQFLTLADFLLMVVSPRDSFNWKTVGHKMNSAVKITANCIKSSTISSFAIYCIYFCPYPEFILNVHKTSKRSYFRLNKCFMERFLKKEKHCVKSPQQIWTDVNKVQ